MYVRICTWECDLQKADEAVEMFRRDIIPAMKRHPECIGMQMMGDGTHRVTLSIFKSEQDYRAFLDKKTEFGGYMDKFAETYVEGSWPTILDYPILISSVDTAAGEGEHDRT